MERISLIYFERWG